MSDKTIVVKWGGSLITDKSAVCVAKRDSIDKLSEMSASIIEMGNRLIIVHGAGGFGHAKASRWRLNEGRVSDFSLHSDGITQDEAMQIVRGDMLELNSIVMAALLKNGVDAKTLSPHLTGSNIGLEHTLPEKLGYLLDSNVVPVMYGDVVDVDSDAEFGILSGDDICTLLCKEYDVQHLIFAIGDIDGLLDVESGSETPSLIERHKVGSSFTSYDTPDDITGGMKLKLHRAEQAKKYCPRVSFVNGSYPERIIQAIDGIDFRGTELVLGE